MIILIPSGDQRAAILSPCSSNEIVVLEKYARITEGFVLCHAIDLKEPNHSVTLTLTRHTVKPLFVRVQKRVLVGLGNKAITGSGGRCGNDGSVDNWRAVVVGKYMVSSWSSRSMR